MVYLPQPNVDLAVISHSPTDGNGTNGAGSAGSAAPKPEGVLLVPGKLTEVTARIKNNSQQALRVSLGIQGNFPDAWFTPAPHFEPTENGTWREAWRENFSVADRQSLMFGTDYFQLQPRQVMSINLGFTLPESFFEAPHALRSRENLDLSYSSEIFLHQTADSEQPSVVQLIAYKTLQLYPRPEPIYQKFLPEFYQTSDFLGRFLNITEQSFEPVYDTTETFWAYLDPLLAPKALVPFLAHWVAWPMNPRLTLAQQRRLIRHAVEIYQWRGTARGLKLCLHLCTSLDTRQIEVIEPDEREFALGEITLGDQPSLGGGKAYHFAVILKPESQEQLNGLDEVAIRVLIEQEKPAFCTYDLEIVYPATPSPPTSDPVSQTAAESGTG